MPQRVRVSRPAQAGSQRSPRRPGPPQRAVADPRAAAGHRVPALAGQQRRVRVVPVVAELVPHVGQPPLQQAVRPS